MQLKRSTIQLVTTRQRCCGKVMFSIVSVYRGGRGLMWPSPMMHWTSPCREPLTPASPPPRTWNLTAQSSPGFHGLGTRTGTPHGTDIWWSRVETCSNLFTWDPPPSNGTEAHTVGKRAVRILLEYFLVFNEAWLYVLTGLLRHVTSEVRNATLEISQIYHWKNKSWYFCQILVDFHSWKLNWLNKRRLLRTT